MHLVLSSNATQTVLTKRRSPQHLKISNSSKSFSFGIWPKKSPDLNRWSFRSSLHLNRKSSFFYTFKQQCLTEIASDQPGAFVRIVFVFENQWVLRSVVCLAAIDAPHWSPRSNWPNNFSVSKRSSTSESNCQDRYVYQKSFARLFLTESLRTVCIKTLDSSAYHIAD